MSIPRILDNPTAIEGVVCTYFPNAKIELNIQKDQLASLTVCLDTQNIFRLTQPLLGQAFSEEIAEVKKTYEFYALLKQDMPPYPFNFDDFYVRASLKNWQQFRRLRHEQKDQKRCADVIIKYLKTKELQEVSYLGLSPDQVTAANKSNYIYFQQVAAKLNEKPNKERWELFKVLEEHYPHVTQHICDHESDLLIKNYADKKDTLYEEIFNHLSQQVVGQPNATEKMATTLSSQKRNSRNAILLFVGPTGVGKTELAKATSTIKKNRFVSFPMNQYQDQSAVATFFGSASGYIGSTDKPLLAKELEKYNPVLISSAAAEKVYRLSNVVILFDEFEKAHNKFTQSLLTLFDEGYFKVSYTNDIRNVTVRYNLEKCVIICTSNLYQDNILQAFLNKKPMEDIAERFVELNALKEEPQSYSRELLGRMRVVPFGPIPKGECYQKLIKNKLNKWLIDLKREIPFKELHIKNQPLLLKALEDKLYGNGTNIRKIEKHFEDWKGIIYKERKNWADPANTKLTFSYENALCLKVAVHLSISGKYHPIFTLPLESI